MKRVLLTGGAGFIGVNLVARLSAAGTYHITVLDNESLGSRGDLNEFDVTFLKGDVCNESDLAPAVEGQDCIVHLAADTRVIESIENPRRNFETNVVGSFHLLEACRKWGVQNVIAASTGGAILGDAPAPVHEGMVAQPLSPYGASKLAMEGYLSAYNASYGLKTCALRFSNIYGPRSFHKGSVVAHFFKQLLQGKELVVYGDGSQARDFLFVEDLAEAIQQAMEANITGVYQLGSGRPTTIVELLETLSQVTGQNQLPVRNLEFRPGEVYSTWCEISKARHAFGYDPETSLFEGVQRTWAWFRDNWPRTG